MTIISALFAYPVQAAKDASDLIGEQPVSSNILSEEAVDQYKEDSTAKTGADKVEKVNGKENTVTAWHQDAKSAALANDQESYIARIFASLFEMFADFLNWMISKATGESQDGFQIEKLLFNDYKIFDINFFTKVPADANLSTVANAVRDSVAGWYYGIRIIAIIASLAVLIYISIRMALSTLSDQKVKYKKMLQSWVMSIIILFTLHYIVLAMVYVSDALVNMLQNIKGSFEIETTLKANIEINQYKGWEALSRGVMLLVLAFIQFKFLLIYFKRTVVAAFLLIISPLITITYSIDKVADNAAQAFKNWMSEMIMVSFMQPMHALLFLIIAFSTSEIIKFAPFIGIVLLWSITKGEAILRKILGLGGASSIGSLKDTKVIPLSL